MFVYLLLPLPTLVAALLFRRLGRWGLAAVWAATSLAMVLLLPVGSRDFATYQRDYEDIHRQPLAEVVLQDPLYATAVWSSGRLGIPGTVFFLTLAIVALGFKLLALRRLCAAHTLPLALYMCSFFFLHEFTQMRAALALGIALLGLAALPHSRQRFLLLSLLAILLHIQAALWLLCVGLVAVLRTPWRLRLFSLLALGLVAMSVLGLTDRVAQQVFALVPDPRVAIYLLLAEEATGRPNPLSVMSLLALLTGLVGLWSVDRSPAPAKPVPLHLQPQTSLFVGLILGSCALAALGSVPIAAFRISEHFFSTLPAALWLLADRLQWSTWRRRLFWPVALAFLYLFLVHSPYLLDPATGAPTRDDA
jgi:hypothetical protein